MSEIFPLIGLDAIFSDPHITCMKNRKTAQNPTILPPEGRIPLEAAERISAMMALSLRLLEDGGMHAAMGKGDAIGALNAAARLIKSNADVTRALMLAVQGETRHRSLVETRSGTLPGLNPNFSDSPSGRMSPEKEEELRSRLQRRLDHAMERHHEQLGKAIISKDDYGRGPTSATDTA